MLKKLHSNFFTVRTKMIENRHLGSRQLRNSGEKRTVTKCASKSKQQNNGRQRRKHCPVVRRERIVFGLFTVETFLRCKFSSFSANFALVAL